MMNKTKANVPTPPSKSTKSRLMVAAPPPQETPDNLSKPSDDVLRDLNFKVAPDFHRRFKLTATSWSMSMKDLLEACYQAWVEKHGASPSDDLFRK